MSNIYESKHALVTHKLSRLRDKNTEPKKFRELVREIAGLLAYEATANVQTSEIEIETPLEKMKAQELKEKIGLVPILRAGLGMVEGIWELMPTAEVWHIGLYRDEKTLQPVEYYNKLPVDPRVAVCLILDPMLATGGSATATADIQKAFSFQNVAIEHVTKRLLRARDPILVKHPQKTRPVFSERKAFAAGNLFSRFRHSFSLAFSLGGVSGIDHLVRVFCPKIALARDLGDQSLPLSKHDIDRVMMAHFHGGRT